MAEQLLMMALSPTMSEGTIAKWKVAEGFAFAAGSVLCEVETDKASMDYEAAKDAVLLKILVPEGGKAAVGDPIAVVGKAGEDPGPFIPAAVKSASLPSAAAAAAPAPVLPRAPSFAPEPPRVPTAASGAGVAMRPSAPSSYPPSSPLARALARELGIDLRSARGSGPGGRVVERDVRAL